MLQKLVNNLSRIGMHTHLSEYLSGSRTLLLSHGGRVLGLFTANSDENFFWTHPALQTEESARAFYRGRAWHNSGGDRTWLSPEIDLFFPKYPDVTTYWQPRELDPGHYAIERSAKGLSLINDVTLTFARSGQQISLQISKSIEDASNPLEREMSTLRLSATDYAGYTLHTSLEFREKQTPGLGPVGLWNLIQLPLRGELLVSTFRTAIPKMYMGTASTEGLTVGEHVTRYRTGRAGVIKFGISAQHARGRIGYLWRNGGRCSLVVRQFSVDPSGQYIDAPRNQPADIGDAVQCCSVNNDMGNFSELEYHVPAIGGRTGRWRSEDTSEVWAFRGPTDEIHRVATRLFGTQI